jgi:hypothetical protein
MSQSSVSIFVLYLTILLLTFSGDGGILYLYARKEFKWDEQQYTKFQTCVISRIFVFIDNSLIPHPSLVVSAVGAFIVMPLLSFYWKVHDATIGILATISKVVSLVIMSLAWNGNSIMY